MENDEQALEAINSNDELVFEESADSEDVDELKNKLAELEEAKRQLTARAHKAESEAKALKQRPTEAPQIINNNTLSADDVDIKILQSQGVDEEHVEYLKKLAKVNGTSILAAQADPIFLIFKEKKEAEKRSAEASLGASRGSSQARKTKTLNTSGLSPEEHKELWKKQTGL